MKIFEQLERQRAWNEDERMVLESVRRLAADLIAPNAEHADRTSEFPWKNIAAKGWTLSGSGRAYTGMPFTLRTSNFDLATGEANRPDRIRKGSLDNPTAQRWYDVSAFPLVPTSAFRFGTAGRNILDGPGFMALNFALARRWTTSEHTSLQFRWEVFNAANHTNFDLPENLVNAANAGSIITAADSRQMQFGLKFHF